MTQIFIGLWHRKNMRQSSKVWLDLCPVNRKTWYFTLLALILLVLSVDYFFIHILFPEKKKAFLEKLFDSPPELGYSLPLPSGIKTAYPPSNFFGENNFKKMLSECFSDPALSKSQNPKDFLAGLESAYGIKRRVFHNESINFTNAQNEPMQLRTLPISNESNHIREIHLFKIEPDGLPSPITLDPTKAQNPSTEFLETLLKDATVTYHQLKETVFLGNENVAVLDWVNGEIDSLQTVGDKNGFSCKQMTCVCD